MGLLVRLRAERRDRSARLPEEVIVLPHPTRTGLIGRTRRPSPALVVALVALFFSLTGIGLAGKRTVSTDPLVGVHETHVTKTVSTPRGQLGLTLLSCPGKHEFAINASYVLDGDVNLFGVSSSGIRSWVFGYVNESTTGTASTTFSIECLKFLH